MTRMQRLSKKLFQSTLPVGGATAWERDLNGESAISIHAPRGGSDDYLLGNTTVVKVFQSTLPVGGATRHRGSRPRRS